MKRGEIVWVDLESPAGGQGREQSGKRPALVISGGDTDGDNPMVIVIPLTTNKSALRFPHTILIPPTKKNGLKSESVALAFQCRALDKRRVNSTLGEIEPSLMNKIQKLMLNLLELN